jgi:hemolysin activation/secretion protein
MISFKRVQQMVGVLALCGFSAMPLRAAAQVVLPANGQSLADVAFVPQRFEVLGVTAYDAAQLLTFAWAHAASGNSAPTLKATADAMALMYREDGYPLAEVSAVADPATGILRWQVSEGHVDAVEVSEPHDRLTAAVLARLQPLTRSQPLHQADLERALALVDDMPEVSMTSRLVPSAKSSGHTLQVTIHRTPRQGWLAFDLVPLKPGHSKRLIVQDQRHGLAQPGDMLRLVGVVTHEPSRGHSVFGNLTYRVPVGLGGNYLEAIAGNGRSVRDLSGVPSRSDLRGLNLSLAWGLPLARDLHGHTHLIAALEHANASQRWAGQTPQSEATAVRLYWVNAHTNASSRLRQTSVAFSAGQRPSTKMGASVDGERHFAHFRAAYGLSGPWTLGDTALTQRLEGALQWSSHALPAVEKTTLGHYPYLRGYAPAEVAGDRGLGATWEVVRRGSISRGMTPVVPFGFVSAGHVHSVAHAGRQTQGWTLASVGLGLRGVRPGGLSAETWLAVPLRDGPLSRKGKVAFFMTFGTQW